MYDSRSDKPMINGTHRNGHAMRSWREMGKGDLIDWGTPRARILATPRIEREAIAEGLSEYHDPEEGVSWMQECIEDMSDSWVSSVKRVNRTYTSESTKPSAKRPKEAPMYDLTIPHDPRNTREIAPRKPRVAKHKPRLTAERFDPTKVSRTLNSPALVAKINPNEPASIRQPAHN